MLAGPAGSLAVSLFSVIRAHFQPLADVRIDFRRVCKPDVVDVLVLGERLNLEDPRVVED